jgi:hypothetical protein
MLLDCVREATYSHMEGIRALRASYLPVLSKHSDGILGDHPDDYDLLQQAHRDTGSGIPLPVLITLVCIARLEVLVVYSMSSASSQNLVQDIYRDRGLVTYVRHDRVHDILGSDEVEGEEVEGSYSQSEGDDRDLDDDSFINDESEESDYGDEDDM